jgi:hypothetical protein
VVLVELFLRGASEKTGRRHGYACGQRLAAALRTEVPRLRAAGKLQCGDPMAEKLVKISAKTIDRLLRWEKQVRRIQRPRSGRTHPLLYQKIPVKVASDRDTSQVGNVQVDCAEHCGRPRGGQYIHTVSTVDIASGWWEGRLSPRAPSAAAFLRSQPVVASALDCPLRRRGQVGRPG